MPSKVKPDTLVLGEFGVAMEAVAPAGTLTTDQTPIPAVGVVAVNVLLSAHTILSAPAKAGSGWANEVTVTSAKLGVQALLETVQRKRFIPTESPVTALVASFGVTNAPVPCTTDQIPIPLVGFTPFKVTFAPHTDCAVPAFATEGGVWRVMITLEAEGTQGALLIVQVKV